MGEHERVAGTSHHQGGDSEGWTRVERRHRSSKVNFKENLYYKGKSSKPILNHMNDFNKVLRDRATSFFFTKFSESWDSNALWKMFNRYGKVTDIYMAFKRTKRGKKFGFGQIFKDAGRKDPIAKPLHQGPYFHKEDFPPFPRSDNNHRHFDETLKAKLDRCWVAKAKNFEILKNAWDIITKNGLEDCKIKYVGGLSFLFEWPSFEAATKSLSANMLWLQQWFDVLKMWKDNDEAFGRLAWINFDGLPLLGRNLKSVKSIAKDFGKLLEVGRLDFDVSIIHPVKALMLLPCMNDLLPLLDLHAHDTNSHNYHPDDDDVEGSLFEDELVDATAKLVDDDDHVSSEHHMTDQEEEKSRSVQCLMVASRVAKHAGIENVSILNDKNVSNSLSPGFGASSEFVAPTVYSNFECMSYNNDVNGPVQNKDDNGPYISAEVGMGPLPDLNLTADQPGISLKCNGLGSIAKKNWVRDLSSLECPSFLGIQESKLSSIDMFLIHSLWPNGDIDFAFVGSDGASGVLGWYSEQSGSFKCWKNMVLQSEVLQTLDTI
ncbi:nucleotide-binding alpha-beta plait domain-containing protein [Tanacetum coccineum]